MNFDLEIDVTKDTASPMVKKLAQALAHNALLRYVGAAALTFTKAHLLALSPNRMGWPSQGFYREAALGTRLEVSPEHAVIRVENENAPGAMKHQYNGGQEGRTTINMKDKLLTIPARQEFYGHSAGEFNNLRFVAFASGAKALVINTGGTDRLNNTTWKTGRGSRTGTGARTASMVAFWLKESVEQDAKPEVLPTKEDYLRVCEVALRDGFDQLTGGLN